MNLGATGWDDNTEYAFRLDFSADNVKVFVDDMLELDIMGSFADGGFGFYNYSQASVLYAGVTSDVLPPTIPLPATLPLLLTGLIGVGALYRKKAA